MYVLTHGFDGRDEPVTGDSRTLKRHLYTLIARRLHKEIGTTKVSLTRLLYQEQLQELHSSSLIYHLPSVNDALKVTRRDHLGPLRFLFLHTYLNFLKVRKDRGGLPRFCQQSNHRLPFFFQLGEMAKTLENETT